MLPLAIKQAEMCLQRCRQAYEKAVPTVEELPEGTKVSLTPVVEAWGDFLVAANRFYSKLKDGATNDPTSAHWFARKKGERKKDALLQYLHQARNVEEHGLGVAVENLWPGVELPPGAIVMLTNVSEDLMEVRNLGSIPIQVGHPQCVAMAVTDKRFGDVFEPPKAVDETPIIRPRDLMELGIKSMETILEEARQLPSD